MCWSILVASSAADQHEPKSRSRIRNLKRSFGRRQTFVTMFAVQAVTAVFALGLLTATLSVKHCASIPGTSRSFRDEQGSKPSQTHYGENFIVNLAGEISISSKLGLTPLMYIELDQA